MLKVIQSTPSKLLFLHKNFLTFVKEIFGLSDSGIFIIRFFFSACFFVTFQESAPLLIFLDFCPANSLSVVSCDTPFLVQLLANWNLWMAIVVLRASFYNYGFIFVHSNFAGLKKYFLPSFENHIANSYSLVRSNRKLALTYIWIMVAFFLWWPWQSTTKVMLLTKKETGKYCKYSHICQKGKRVLSSKL